MWFALLGCTPRDAPAAPPPPTATTTTPASAPTGPTSGPTPTCDALPTELLGPWSGEIEVSTVGAYYSDSGAISDCFYGGAGCDTRLDAVIEPGPPVLLILSGTCDPDHIAFPVSLTCVIPEFVSPSFEGVAPMEACAQGGEGTIEARFTGPREITGSISFFTLEDSGRDPGFGSLEGAFVLRPTNRSRQR